MSNISAEARKAVNDALLNSDQSDITLMVDAARSSFSRRDRARAEKERREAKQERLHKQERLQQQTEAAVGS